SLFIRCVSPLLALLSFPTRRSSDLYAVPSENPDELNSDDSRLLRHLTRLVDVETARTRIRDELFNRSYDRLHLDMGTFWGTADRSEEHTSELQSRENLVCRLLLEKK